MELFNVLLENCKVASYFFLFLLLVRPLTEKFFSQSWHYLAFRVNLLLFFLPIRWLSEGIAPFLVKLFPNATMGKVTHQTELAPNFTITWGEQIVGESQQFTEVNSIDWTGFLISTWVLVAIGLFLWKTYCFIRFHSEVKGLSAIQCPVIQKFFKKCKELMGFTGAIPLLGSENIYSPVLLGLYHPKILLPVKKIQEKHLEYIFTHELTHLRRKDLWWKALLTPLTILYWWNPLIYLFSWQFKNVLEYSCDEEVVKLRSHEERKCYGKAILESIDEEQTNPVLGVSFRTPEQLLEMRLIKMLKFNEMKASTKVLSGVLMSAMLLGAAIPNFAEAMSTSEENSNPSEKSTQFVSSVVDSDMVVSDSSSVSQEEVDGNGEFNALMFDLVNFGAMVQELTELLPSEEPLLMNDSITWQTETGLLTVSSEKSVVLRTIANKYAEQIGVATSYLLEEQSISLVVGQTKDGHKFLYTDNEFIAYISGLPNSNQPDDFVKEYDVPFWLEEQYNVTENVVSIDD